MIDDELRQLAAEHLQARREHDDSEIERTLFHLGRKGVLYRDRAHAAEVARTIIDGTYERWLETLTLDKVCEVLDGYGGLGSVLVDSDLSDEIADATLALPGACWLNAYRGLRHLSQSCYVEGWAVTEIPIEHGWLEKDGRIVDPTLYLDLPTFYVVGVRYTIEEANAGVTRASASSVKQCLPIVWHEGFGGNRCAEYTDARSRAYALHWLLHFLDLD